MTEQLLEVMQKLVYRVFDLVEYIIRRFSACTRVPHKEGNYLGEPLLFNVGIQTLMRVLQKTEVFARTGN